MAKKYFSENNAKVFANNVKELVDEVRDVELTYAEYQALSEEEKNNGKSYYVKDIEDIDYSDYEMLDIVSYSPAANTIFIGYTTPTGFTPADAKWDVRVTNKKGALLHSGTLVVASTGSSIGISWANNNAPTDFSLYTNASGRVYQWKVLFNIKSATPNLGGKIEDFTNPTTVKGYFQTLTVADMLMMIRVISSYNVYIKKIS